MHARLPTRRLVPAVPNEYSERNNSFVTLVFHCRRRRVVAAARLRSPKARGILQQYPSAPGVVSQYTAAILRDFTRFYAISCDLTRRYAKLRDGVKLTVKLTRRDAPRNHWPSAFRVACGAATRTSYTQCPTSLVGWLLWPSGGGR